MPPSSTCAVSGLFLLIPFLMGCGVDLYIPSLPTISKQFNVADNIVQQTISMYMLGYGLGQAFLGVLSDFLGRRKI